MSSQPIDGFLPYLQLIGVSAIVSVLVSAFINYWINIKEFKKKARLEIAKEKTALFSYVIFQLDKMRFRANAIKKNTGSC